MNGASWFRKKWTLECIICLEDTIHIYTDIFGKAQLEMVVGRAQNCSMHWYRSLFQLFLLNTYIHLFSKLMTLNRYYRVDLSKPKEDSKHNSDFQLFLIMDNKKQIGSIRNFKR